MEQGLKKKNRRREDDQFKDTIKIKIIMIAEIFRERGTWNVEQGAHLTEQYEVILQQVYHIILKVCRSPKETILCSFELMEKSN